MLIPGGRDVHYLEYSNQNEGTSVTPEARIRYKFYSECMQKLPKQMPIFGICYGFQFLNVYFGGSLVQDLSDKKEHYNDNWFSLKEGSKIRKIIGESRVLGLCYHHQGIGKFV
jgi:putative glutamine amidotransferase